ncbi:DUF1176 domain-containing protein [Mesorhizobium sp. LHD-90]|uniref:DUF1176 domain-containing protein n=1 Tax=Mesorhizobium sp. LHD-90 TaxID=3071414 RepID=UPI0027E0E73C|nr:DUF1176 domain-containing protein [Mesorhizobium sp. LHD-90]MDQ6437218.1 DUF1176 domain-containing protein [Mesorhizobium sp. LHD-90]
MRTAFLTTAFILSSGGIALAQSEQPPYLDDRSDAAALVRSFYNAIDRQEYARAWDYFGDRKPSKDFQAFIKGYENTQSVRIVTGEPSAEGAAGSTFYALPVAFVATNKDNSEQVFAGCYTVRQINPQIQEPPFRGLAIEKAELKPSEQPFEEKLLERCGDGPAPEPRDAVLEQAKKAFAALHAGQCQSVTPDGASPAPETYTIAFRRASSSEDEPESQARLFRFYCGMGAYNESHVYYLHDEVEGLREQQFATPELDLRYADENSDEKVESMAIIGYKVDDALVNSFYDEATLTIASHAKWRGVGDASSSGTWIFRNGAFTLVKYDVDASYDGEINPETVLDFHTGP